MRMINRWSIKTKLILLSVISVGIALTLSAVGVIINELYTMRAFKMQALEVQSGMLAFNSTGVLSFTDVSAAKQLLASLRSQPTVEFACLYDHNGRILATYPADARIALSPAAPAEDICRFTDEGRIEVFRRVIDRGEHVGGLYLRANADDVRRQLTAYSKMIALVAFFALIVSGVLAVRLQQSISRPILNLARTATNITSLGDYSIRVEKKSEDELGVLCTEFNRMLDRIDTSDKALKKMNDALAEAHEQLEERVIARTVELQEEIAKRERTQRELVQAKEAAETANVAKSQFLANMSHEIRTPLNAIIGFTDLLVQSGNRCDDSEYEDYLKTIKTSGKHLLELINDVLDLSKIEADRLEIEHVRCSPHEIISEIVSVLRVKALEKKLTLDFQWCGPVPETICSDPARLRQLLMNLVGNAIKFTEAGGVRIVAELVQVASDPQLVVQVIDTGIGIPRDKHDAIFDPFIQADASVTRQFGGTGLGLTISRRVAQAMGGRIEVSSEVGKGSKFIITIPTGSLTGVPILDAPLGDGVHSIREKQVVTVSSLKGARILLVEDGDTNRRLIGLVLQRAGAVVVTAENGSIAVEFASKERFDLILMDMQMPVMDGYTAATVLRQRGVRIPIIALTAHAMKNDKEKCLAAGCSGYLPKPVDADQLLRTVVEMLGAAGDIAGSDLAVDTPVGDGTRRATSRETNSASRVLPGQPANAAALISTLPTDDPDFREIVEEFIERLQQQLAALQRAFELRDYREVASLAHWLKGAGGTAGFPAFTQPARRLESLAEDKQCEEIEATLDDLLNLAQSIALPSRELKTVDPVTSG